ncbi:MAG: replication initiator, partial [Actinomycetes bacterium]
MSVAAGGILQEVLDRGADAGAYGRWEAQLRQVGYCTRPLRLVGEVRTVDTATGELTPVYSTSTEPDGTLLKACEQRRETVCRPCSAVYRSDAYQLVAAGLRGGKGVPATVAGHPTLFVTFTAPSFGPVHSRREKDGRVQRCRPRRDGETCPHGTSLACRRRHAAADECLGEPLCVECFDYEGAVLWNAHANELWRRTTIYVRRALAAAAGMTVKRLATLVRIRYVKVAEYQARGLVHFHAVIRLDAAPDPEAPGEVAPPPAGLTADVLEDAVRRGAAAVSVPVPAAAGGTGGHARWGTQLDVRRLVAGDGKAGSGSVASYVAKYATKSTDPLGRLDAPLTGIEDLDGRGVRGHVRRLAQAAWRLGDEEALEHLRLCRHAHTLGFRGHWMTKSLRYSTTLTALRRARVEWALARRGEDVTPDEDRTSATWRLVGVGYRTAGDAWLAESAAARARE